MIFPPGKLIFTGTRPNTKRNSETLNLLVWPRSSSVTGPSKATRPRSRLDRRQHQPNKLYSIPLPGEDEDKNR